ncbi:MAG: META domain-containing protein [Anaerolineales bacterium]|nr:META domain-containing protein [Anaerolineales bacterium]
MKKLLPIVIAVLIGLSACAGNSVSLEGEWKLISYGAVNNPTLALPDVETSFNFGTDQKLNGNVGCNLFGANYKVTEKTIAFDAAFSTRKFCEGVMNQEDAILKILSEQTLKFEMSGEQLTLTSADGASTIILEKK